MASIVLAFSRPAVESDISFINSNIPSNNIIVLDNSYSMALQTGQGQVFELAKGKVVELIEELPEGSSYNLITGLDGSSGFTRDIGIIQQELNLRQVRNASWDSLDIRNQILAAIDENKGANNNLFYLTDYQRNSLLPEVGNISNFGVDLGQVNIETVKNLAIDSIGIGQSILVPGGQLDISVYLRNTGALPVPESQLRIFANGKVVGETSLLLPPSESRVYDFLIKLDNLEKLEIKAEIGEDDIAYDNICYAALSSPEYPSILFIKSNDESSFGLELVFSAIEEIKVEKINSSQIPNEPMKGQLLVVPSSNYSKADYKRFSDYYEKGGRILMFAPLNNGSEFLEFGESIFNSKVKSSTIDRSEPIELTLNEDYDSYVDVFIDRKGIVESVLSGKQFYPEGGRVLARLGSTPFIVEAQNDNLGSIIYFSTSSGSQYSDFVSTDAFAPFVFISTLNLSGISPEIVSFQTGVNALIEVEAGNNNYKLIDPSGNSFETVPMQLGSKAILDFGKLTDVGNYSVYSDERLVKTFSVNHPPNESILDFLDPKKSYPDVRIIEAGSDFDEIVQSSGGVKEIWQVFVALAILLALVELYIGNNT
ncbi:MAG: BatA and WFA domain-containing protein [Candidatus Kapaibacteriales bacterium]